MERVKHVSSAESIPMLRDLDLRRPGAVKKRVQKGDTASYERDKRRMNES